MRRLCFSALSLAFVLTPLMALDDSKADDKSRSPNEQYRAITGEYDKAYREYITRVSALRRRAGDVDKEEAKKLREKMNELRGQAPKAEDYAERLLAVAEEHPDDPAAVDCLVWVAMRVRTGPLGEKALEQLIASHMDSDKIGPLATQMARANTPIAKKFIEVAKKHGNRAVLGQIAYSEVQMLKYGVDYVKMLNDPNASKQRTAAYKRLFSAEQAAELEGLDVPGVLKKYEAALEEIVKEYGDLPGRGGDTLGDQAGRALYELRFLSEGNVSPDIEGEDTDGKAFKLSDYRGKVVMLDFWGHW